MSQKPPISSNDRVSPRRRFHRPAAEFLGARRQVPVLTGLPSIEEDPSGALEIQHEVQQPQPVEPIDDVQVDSPSAEDVDLLSAEDIVEPEVEPVPQAAPANIREIAPENDLRDDTWREWAYPVAGTLMAVVLVYTAWVGLNKTKTPEIQQAQIEQPVQETFYAAQDYAVDDSAAQDYVVDDSVAQDAVDPVLVASAPVSPTEPTPPVESKPTMVQPPSPPLNRSSYVERSFVEAPIVFAEPSVSNKPQSTEFVEHEVAGWEVGMPEMVNNTDNPMDSTNSPSFPTPADTPVEPEAEPAIPFMAAGPMAAAPREQSGELTSDEPSEVEYPTTEFADQLPGAPQAAIDRSPGFAPAQSREPSFAGDQQLTGEQKLSSASAPTAEPTPILPATPNDQIAGFAPQYQQPFGVNPSSVQTQQSAQVIVNPHIRPLAPEQLEEKSAFETASVPAGPAMGPQQTMDTPLVASVDAPVTKSIYGSFPSLNAPQKPSIDQVRLNGIIEPFSQTRQ